MWNRSFADVLKDGKANPTTVSNAAALLPSQTTPKSRPVSDATTPPDLCLIHTPIRSNTSSAAAVTTASASASKQFLLPPKTAPVQRQRRQNRSVLGSLSPNHANTPTGDSDIIP